MSFIQLHFSEKIRRLGRNYSKEAALQQATSMHTQLVSSEDNSLKKVHLLCAVFFFCITFNTILTFKISKTGFQLNRAVNHFHLFQKHSF